MNSRNAIIAGIEKKDVTSRKQHLSPKERFGCKVFNRQVMKKMLSKEVFKNVSDAVEGRAKINREYADAIATAMKEWAISLGATHFCHWFQPLTGSSAEKHDAFLDYSNTGDPLDKFTGSQLIQGEPDASSFPSGGLRSTYEARGYTGWDPTSPAFIWEGGDGRTLCVPSFFFSWTGNVLDTKIPLHRSDKAIQDAVKRLLVLTGLPAEQVFSTLGLEQEYFVIDRGLRNLRPDLVLIGRTVFGAPPPKGQELQDHYFGAVKDRILAYMEDFEEAALSLGIPIKTRHNEVAPAQHEVAPNFERSSLAIDHNILLMELMRQVAVNHQLSCLLHEKPFAGLNGSGKHANWSLATDQGINLLDPSETPENNLHFLILLTAILNAVSKHADLLRAAIGSASNDCRLGGHEAPPAIISVYLGQELENVLNGIEAKGKFVRGGSKHAFDFGLQELPELKKDNTDRNRTSPFAFTGNKFEFRAVGASANPAFAITVLNVIVAESLNEILDVISHSLHMKQPTKEELVQVAIPILQKFLKKSKKIRFSGDNYSGDWVREAKRRGLLNHTKSVNAFRSLLTKETAHLFNGILDKQELNSRYEIMLDTYISTIVIETNLMLDIFKSQILPAALATQKSYSKSIENTRRLLGKKGGASQLKLLKELSTTIDRAIDETQKLERALAQASLKKGDKRADAFAGPVKDQGEKLREVVDHLEGLVDDELWPLPKYRELLFII